MPDCPAFGQPGTGMNKNKTLDLFKKQRLEIKLSILGEGQKLNKLVEIW
jgi:hypothetical protein